MKIEVWDKDEMRYVYHYPRDVTYCKVKNNITIGNEHPMTFSLEGPPEVCWTEDDNAEIFVRFNILSETNAK